MKRHTFHGHKPPGRDSPRAVAQATLFLTGARSLENVTADGLARQCHLSAKRAEYMLAVAQQRRAENG